MKVLQVAVLVLSVVGCAPSVKSQADTAYSKKQYLQAAELYDQVLRKDPNDKHALGRRIEARTMVLRDLLAATARARTAGDADGAMAQLAEMLARRDGWGMKVEGELARALSIEVVASGSAIATAVANTSNAAGPLSGQAMAQHYALLLVHAEFANWRREIDDSVHVAARTVCVNLVGKAKTPYLTWAIAAYCRHFGLEEPPLLARSNLKNKLVVDGMLGGVPPDDSARIRDTLAAAFAESVWFAPDAARPGHATLTGRLGAAFDSRTVSRTANWTEQVPYTDYVTEQESYQEPYDDTETYYEQVPHTEYHDGKPETVYRSESRTRTVTKYRTAYRPVTKPVTRYRDVPRSFNYEAIERTGRYTSAVRVKIDRDEPDVMAEINGNFFEHGYDHDVYNAQAGVSPERANLPTLGAFTAVEEGRLREALRVKLDARWADLYCSLQRFTPEDAATCAYLAPASIPSGAHAALQQMFGPDEALLQTVLVR